MLRSLDFASKKELDTNKAIRLDAIARRLDAIALRLNAIALRLDAIALRLDAIALRLDAIALRLDAIALRLDAIALRLDAIAFRLDAIALRLEENNKAKLGIAASGSFEVQREFRDLESAQVSSGSILSRRGRGVGARSMWTTSSRTEVVTFSKPFPKSLRDRKTGGNVQSILADSSRP